jgi:hypothetical protein
MIGSLESCLPSELVMRIFLALLLGSSLAACGPSEEEFLDAYAESFCTYMFDCVDQAGLTFDGWESTEACVETKWREFGSQGNECVFQPSAATACLDQMAVLTCPTETVTSEYELPLPVVCVDQVYENCDAESGAGSDTTEPTEPTEPTDTGGNVE